MTPLAPLLEAFFTERLRRQTAASPNTVAAYRDAFRLLLHFAQERLGTPAAALPLRALDATLIGAFLEHLETRRRNGARTRNARLAAIRSFFHFVAPQEPAHAAVSAAWQPAHTVDSQSGGETWTSWSPWHEAHSLDPPRPSESACGPAMK